MLNAEDMRVDYISPNIEKLMGIPEKQARANIHAMDSLVQNDDTVRVLDKLHEIPPGEQGEWDREYVHRKTGEVRWFHVIALCSDINGFISKPINIEEVIETIHSVLEKK